MLQKTTANFAAAEDPTLLRAEEGLHPLPLKLLTSARCQAVDTSLLKSELHYL